MGKIVIPQYDYGHPKNEDYAYDAERQRKVDEEADKERAALKKALQEFADHNIDEAKLRAHLGKDKPWTRDELNGAWAALVDHEVV